jgi:hypothetical protein
MIDSPVNQSQPLSDDNTVVPGVDEVPRGTKSKPPAAGKGRKKGVPNKATSDVRAVIAVVASKNVDKIEGWLTRIGRKNPAKAMDLFLRMLEYHIPKLTRAEIVRPDDSKGRVIDSSQLTAEQRQQLREMILAAAQPTALEHQPAHTLQSMGLGDAQVIDSIDSKADRTSVTDSAGRSMDIE